MFSYTLMPTIDWYYLRARWSLQFFTTYTALTTTIHSKHWIGWKTNNESKVQLFSQSRLSWPSNLNMVRRTMRIQNCANKISQILKLFKYLLNLIDYLLIKLDIEKIISTLNNTVMECCLVDKHNLNFKLRTFSMRWSNSVPNTIWFLMTTIKLDELNQLLVLFK